MSCVCRSPRFQSRPATWKQTATPASPWRIRTVAGVSWRESESLCAEVFLHAPVVVFLLRLADEEKLACRWKTDNITPCWLCWCRREQRTKNILFSVQQLTIYSLLPKHDHINSLTDILNYQYTGRKKNIIPVIFLGSEITISGAS